MSFAEVRLVSAPSVGEGRPDRRGRHQARRQMADRCSVQVRRALVITGLVLGSAAIVMMLGSFVFGNPPWN